MNVAGLIGRVYVIGHLQAALKAFQLLQRNENLVGAAEGAATGFVGLAQAALCCVCPLLLLVCLSNYPDINTANVQNAVNAKLPSAE